jgi:hypothetical protein
MALALNRRNVSGELYLMLLVTCAVQPLIAISQNGMHQNTLNKMKQKINQNNIKYFQTSSMIKSSVKGILLGPPF